MAHLWLRNADDEWAVLPLEGAAYSVGQSPPRALRDPGRGRGRTSGVALVRTGRETGESWSLVVGEARRAQINGRPLPLGLHVMRDRDEVRIDSVGRLFFSTERLPAVEPFPGAEKPIFCPRCKSEIAEGARAVACPSCSVRHHEDDSVRLRCWSYGETCALCPQPTSVREFRWIPRGM